MNLTIPTTKTIQDYSELKNAELPIGAKVDITLKNNDVITFELAAVNIYGASKIWVTADCYGRHRMKDNWNDKAVYGTSEGLRHLTEDILPLLPDKLQDLIIERELHQKLSDKDGAYGCVCKLWHLSTTEIGAADSEEYNILDMGDIPFPLYNTEKSRVKECEDKGTYPYDLRSATPSSSTIFDHVVSYGALGSIYAADTYGVCFGFCI
jgi:hypothetical protein